MKCPRPPGSLSSVSARKSPRTPGDIQDEPWPRPVSTVSWLQAGQQARPVRTGPQKLPVRGHSSETLLVPTPGDFDSLSISRPPHLPPPCSLLVMSAHGLTVHGEASHGAVSPNPAGGCCAARVPQGCREKANERPLGGVGGVRIGIHSKRIHSCPKPRKLPFPSGLFVFNRRVEAMAISSFSHCQ